MAPSGYKRKSGRRPRQPAAFSHGTPAKKRRVDHVMIEGLEIFSFENELELEFFTNLEEPLPRKMRDFRGFDEDSYEAGDLEILKSSFNRFTKRYHETVRVDTAEEVEVPQFATKSAPRKSSFDSTKRYHETVRVDTADEVEVPQRATKSATRKSSFDSTKRYHETVRVDTADEVEVPQRATKSPTRHVAEESIVLSDEESALEPTGISGVDKEPVQLISEHQAEVITIDSDSDDDVIMVSDPSAPLPQPVRDCVCPNCGKVKRSAQNRRVAESDRDSGIDDTSIVADEVAIITDDDVPASAPVRSKTTPVSAPVRSKTTPVNTPVRSKTPPVSAPVRNKTLPVSAPVQNPLPLPLKDFPPKEMPASPADIHEAQPAETAEPPKEMPPPPPKEMPAQPAEVPTDETPSQTAAEPLSASCSRSPVKANNASSLPPQKSPSPLSSPRPQPISRKPSNGVSSKTQRPSGQLKPRTVVPKTLRVVSKESGKTFFLKINGAKSKILPPSIIKPSTPSSLCNSKNHPESFHYVLPGENPCGVSSVEENAVENVEEPPPKSAVASRAVLTGQIPQPTTPPKFAVGSQAMRTQKIPQPTMSPPKSAVRSQADRNGKVQQLTMSPKSAVGSLADRTRKIPQSTTSPKFVVGSQADRTKKIPQLVLPGEKPCGVSSAEGNAVENVEEPPPKFAVLTGQIPQPTTPPKFAVGSQAMRTRKIPQPTMSPPKSAVRSQADRNGKVQQLTMSPKSAVGSQADRTGKIPEPTMSSPKSAVRSQADRNGKIQQPTMSPKSVVGPETPDVQVQQAYISPQSVVGPQNIGIQTVEVGQANLLPKSVAAPLTVEVGKVNELPRALRLTIPPNTIRVTLPPGFADKNKATKAQPTSTAKGPVQIKTSIVTKPAVIAPSRSPPTGLVKQPAKTDAVAQTYTVVATNFTEMTRLIETRDSATLTSPLSDNANVESLVAESSEPLVLEDDTKSVVKDLIDFVCRQEDFPHSYPHDEERREQLSLDVPCRQLRCRMGCICGSLAKKNVRRVRCKNAECIFGCICMFHGVVLANRHAKTIPSVKVLSISRRKQVLTVLPDCDAESSSSVQSVMKSFLPVQKVGGVGRTGSVRKESTPRSAPGGHSIRQGSAFGSSTQPASKRPRLAHKAPVPRTIVTSTLKAHPTSDLAPANVASPDVPKPAETSPEPAERRLPVPVAQPRKFFGREKTPIPERALMCLTPGFGYVPLGEIHPTVTLDSPFKPGSPKSFLSVRQAAEWLNSKLQIHLNTKMPPDLRWVVADGQTIEKKQQHRLSIALLSSPKCTISRNGAVFSS